MENFELLNLEYAKKLRRSGLGLLISAVIAVVMILTSIISSGYKTPRPTLPAKDAEIGDYVSVSVVSLRKFTLSDENSKIYVYTDAEGNTGNLTLDKSTLVSDVVKALVDGTKLTNPLILYGSVKNVTYDDGLEFTEGPSSITAISARLEQDTVIPKITNLSLALSLLAGVALIICIDIYVPTGKRRALLLLRHRKVCEKAKELKEKYPESDAFRLPKSREEISTGVGIGLYKLEEFNKQLKAAHDKQLKDSFLGTSFFSKG